MSLAKAGYKRVPREVLKAARTYYVRTDGSDANDGLANTAGRAFLTIAKALTAAAALDCSIYDLTIQVQAATWTTAVVLPKMIGSGIFTLLGDSATPANVVISTAAGHAVSAIGTVGTRWFLDGFKLQTSGGGACAINAQDGGLIYYKNIEFGACTIAHVRAANGQAIANGNTTISGSALIHWFGATGGYIFDAGFTITLTGTPAFANAFAQISDGAIAAVNNNTFVGAATGKKFAGASNGIIGATLGSDVNYLPGSLPGTLESGAVYLGLMGGVREKLTANRTYYVRADGSNSNDGLSNTAGGAFLTLQKAWDVVASLDLSIYAVTIKVADGTYAAGVSMAAVPVGGSGIVWEGNVTSPGNVHVSVAGTCFAILAPLPCAMTIKGFKTTFSSTGGSAVRHSGSGQVTVQNMELAGGSTGGFTGAYRADTPSAYLIVGTGQLISGGMSCFAQAIYGGVVQFFGITVTLTGTPAFSWITIGSQNQGYVEVVGVTFSGAATGVRYGASTGGGINTNGAGASFIPGSSAGSATSPGWYI